MKTLFRVASAAAIVALISPLPLLAADTHADRFMRKAIEGNLAEVKVGQLAQQKGATAGVRHFGAVLEQDHSQANQQAIAAASSSGVTPPSQPDDKQRAEYQHLASLSGSEFDRAFLREMVKDHEKDIAEYRKEAKSTSGPAESYAAASLPTLKKHLRLAKSLKRDAGG